MIPDLSHHNQISNDADFQKAARASKMVILKTSEGTTFADPAYKARASMLRALGVAVGSYHFAHPRPTAGRSPETAAEAEAKHFLRLRKGPGPAFLDWEYHLDSISPNYADRWIEAFLAKVPHCVVYCSLSVASTLPGDFPLWVAFWSGDVPEKLGDHPVALHQYTSTGAYPGIRGHVDLSRKIAAGWPPF